MALFFPFLSFYSSFLSFYLDGKKEKRKKRDFLNIATNSEKGFLLLSLVIWIPILVSIFGISFHEVQQAQRRVAMQSRLDICSIKRSEQRKRTIAQIIRANDIIRFTTIAVASLRGISVLTGPLGSVASKLGERALVQANRSAATYQNGLLKALNLFEKIPFCEATTYSKELATCKIMPELSQQFFRSSRSLPDLEAPLIAKGQLMAESTCLGMNLVTKVVLYGDANLFRPNFREVYEK